jgi:pimeloyl-ACP methyl ester carboxylesterase
VLETVTAADGTRLNAIELGPADAPVVLALHGFASTAAANWILTGWERPLLEAGYRLVAFDLRGHGESDRPEDPAAYRLTKLADDALEVLDAAGADRAHVLGYSLGSRLALELARQVPDRILTLNLGGAAGADPAPERLIAMAEGLGLDDPALRAFATGVSADAPPFPDATIDAASERIKTVVVAGSADEIAAGAHRLADRLGATYVELPGRTHANAITARGFKDAVLANLSAG